MAGHKPNTFNIVMSAVFFGLVGAMLAKGVDTKLDQMRNDEDAHALAAAYGASKCRQDLVQSPREDAPLADVVEFKKDADNHECTARLKNGTVLTWTWSEAAKLRAANLATLSGSAASEPAVKNPAPLEYK